MNRKDAQPLPVEAVLPRLTEVLDGGHAVLSSPPGSGKTTRVPLALLDAPWLAGGKILMLEPRRPAARMAAAFMAGQLGEAMGETVGYALRMEKRSGPRTRIEVLTEGLLVRRLQADPELQGVGLVIFDEFHERSLQADLGLALCLDVCGALRDDLRLLVMSATLEEGAVAQLVGGEVVRAGGGLHPVRVEHLERPAGDRWLAATARLVRRACREQAGDVLVFLPGKGEMQRLQQQLEERPLEAQVLQLHGEMDAAGQARVLRPEAGHPRRVVLATDVAETSLTIEGIGAVVDSGLSRKPLYDPDSGLSRLQLLPVSRASAAQRAGRAGRLGPGVCYRAFTEAELARRPAQRPAEILQQDLAPLALELALWGVQEPAELRWLDPPPRAAWRQAIRLLEQLEAVDGQGRITAHGRRMAALGLHPRLAHLLLRGGGSPLAADLAALLSERDPWRYRRDEPRPADLGLRLQALEALRRERPLPAGADAAACRHILRLSGRLQRQAGAGGEAGHGAAGLLSLAYPERIARRRPGHGGRYRLASGKGAVLPPDDGLATAEWLAVASLDAGSREGRIWLALPLDQQELERLHAGRIREEEALEWDEERQRVRCRRRRLLGALELESRERPARGEAATRLLLENLRRLGLEVLEWPAPARQFQARVALARRLEPAAGWPDLSDAWLRDNLDRWLAPWAGGLRSLEALRRLDLTAILAGLLGWEQQRQLEEWLPRRWTFADGSSAAIDYLADPPVLAAPVQRFYGMVETPALFRGRLPLVLHLLSPAGRPLQVTGDLAGFWNGAWEAVKKEMKGRYPRHHWPDDPARARPVGLKRHL